ncbi:hypothetical protein C5C18_01340 [Rathayibacter tritici]|uniref:Uncharacterized protein n=1 Tax=Rathayibacter tritici TaxID=33888 RepID=A0A160KV92_9MICO|nr:hypothetical protein [Rathayibacter tritici]AND17870.1 hypothetical protein A6122_2761 [Rathayibacter tritici]PPF30574.1 hypothetical protein C5C06_04880 [Rathayibacter tritici]PPF66671.1 hypothetical protein C5C21_08355 [Rathayibacter tritici]PPG09056.1 hypothetical protein C5C18_01340 [Rathayibacter tritici]PPI17872.1 hypothetical protein C5D07_04275 [Rathayibacter tritici]
METSFPQLRCLRADERPHHLRPHPSRPRRCSRSRTSRRTSERGHSGAALGRAAHADIDSADALGDDRLHARGRRIDDPPCGRDRLSGRDRRRRSLGTSAEQIEDYRVRLRSLIWAARLLRELSHTKDEGAVLVAVNWAFDAVYDLSEAYWILTGTKKPSLEWQNDHLASLTPTAGEKVGGLLAVRGAMTHRLLRSSVLSPLRDLPYDFAKLTDWVWAEQSWPAAQRLERRMSWYVDHVSTRPLWHAFDEAEYWFVTNSPVSLTPLNPDDTEGWVYGVSPQYQDT